MMDQQRTERPPGRSRIAWVTGLAAVVFAAGIYVLVFRPFHKPEEDGQSKADKYAPPPRLEPAEPETDVPKGLPIVPWGKRHHFPEIRKPWYVPAKERVHAPAEDEPVLGLVVGKQARAYSTNQLNEHEMVIDEIAGVPVLVTY
jgi:hypothetical protein